MTKETIEQSALKIAKGQSKKLLDGIKVLDLSRILAGPWATQLMADYGAEVWKIEKPDVGDDTRSWGPPFIRCGEGVLSAYFCTANRGKKSICIDLTKKDGQILIKKLVSKADIVVENFKVGGLKQYGLDYHSLKTINPLLIYCSITGFGQTGPFSCSPGYDAMIQAAGGLMSVTGEPESEGGKPQKVGVAVTDLMTGMYATTAILAALNYRNQFDVGQYIDLSLLDTQVAMLANQGMNFLVSGDVPERQGNGHPNIVPYQTFACSDHHLLLAVGNDKQFTKACKILGLIELSKDHRFKTNELRVANKLTLIAMMETAFLTHKCQHWLQLFEQEKVPASPVNNIQQAFSHPQIKHRKMRVDLGAEHDFPQIANPVNYSNAELNYNLPPPVLGDSTEEVLLNELELNDEDLKRLKLNNVI